jgi:hypothetical protein
MHFPPSRLIIAIIDILIFSEFIEIRRYMLNGFMKGFSVPEVGIVELGLYMSSRANLMSIVVTESGLL